MALFLVGCMSSMQVHWPLIKLSIKVIFTRHPWDCGCIHYGVITQSSHPPPPPPTPYPTCLLHVLSGAQWPLHKLSHQVILTGPQWLWCQSQPLYYHPTLPSSCPTPGKPGNVPSEIHCGVITVPRPLVPPMPFHALPDALTSGSPQIKPSSLYLNLTPGRMSAEVSHPLWCHPQPSHTPSPSHVPPRCSELCWN